MNWITLVHNPRAITHLYDDVPPLCSMEVLKIHLDRDGPNLKFDMDFPRFADHLPARWEKNSNTIFMELSFSGVSDLHIVGFSTNPVFDFTIEGTQGALVITAGDRNCQIRFSCSFFYIREVSSYIKIVSE
jgi:hypothetical protein